MLLSAFIMTGATQAAAAPVSFTFKAPALEGVRNPYARELWAEVTTPDGRTLLLPAFYSGIGDRFVVRARPDAVGVYRFGRVAETTAGVRRENVAVTLVTDAEVENSARLRLPAVGLDPDEPHAFRRADGKLFYPAGSNLAWAHGEPCVSYYQRALPAFARANLNWMRVWMAHWGQLNLDWIPPELGASPPPGGIDHRVAENWDRILEAAESSGVYLQMVLQHHGQYSTTVNSNWAENPWNAANPGGFLQSPVEFFTSPDAQLITRLKYRYIIARWGWSPAIFAWEFFNEVHWTDAMRQDHEAEVARWHDAMAGYVRSLDVYQHLITTSTENLQSPVYAQMDFYQPHQYSANPLAAPRRFETRAATLDKPVFYGEIGDDQQLVTAEVKQSGLTIMPPIWASVMGEGNFPAQPWDGWKLLEQNRLNELGAVVRFVVLNRLAGRADLTLFSPVVESAQAVPLRVSGSQIWQHRHEQPELHLHTDGREALDLAEVPGVLAGPAQKPGLVFPSQATYHLDFPQATTVTVAVGAVGQNGADLLVTLDGVEVAKRAWPEARGADAPLVELTFPVTAGPHTLVIANTTGPDWIAVPYVDLGLKTSALAAIGRRADDVIALWVWRRDTLYQLDQPEPLAGTVLLDEVPAGAWNLTWWDSIKGKPVGEPVTLNHAGGTLRIGTPAIARHAAAILQRLTD